MNCRNFTECRKASCMVNLEAIRLVDLNASGLVDLSAQHPIPLLYAHIALSLLEKTMDQSIETPLYTFCYMISKARCLSWRNTRRMGPLTSVNRRVLHHI